MINYMILLVKKNEIGPTTFPNAAQDYLLDFTCSERL